MEKKYTEMEKKYSDMETSAKTKEKTKKINRIFWSSICIRLMLCISDIYWLPCFIGLMGA
jgi:hypothetical protein